MVCFGTHFDIRFPDMDMDPKIKASEMYDLVLFQM